MVGWSVRCRLVYEVTVPCHMYSNLCILCAMYHPLAMQVEGTQVDAMGEMLSQVCIACAGYDPTNEAFEPV